MRTVVRPSYQPRPSHSLYSTSAHSTHGHFPICSRDLPVLINDAFYALHHYLDLAAITDAPTSKREDRADRIRVILDAFVNICRPTKGDVLALSLTQSTVDRQQQLIFRLAATRHPVQRRWPISSNFDELQSTARIPIAMFPIFRTQ